MGPHSDPQLLMQLICVCIWEQNPSFEQEDGGRGVQPQLKKDQTRLLPGIPSLSSLPEIAWTWMQSPLQNRKQGLPSEHGGLSGSVRLHKRPEKNL